MKKLTAVDTPIEILDGSEPNPKAKLPTMRGLLKIVLNNQVPKNQEESLDVNQILLKLRLVDSDIEFENAEFRLMKEKVAENQAKMFQGPHGQLMAYIVACEKADDKKDENK